VNRQAVRKFVAAVRQKIKGVWLRRGACRKKRRKKNFSL